jgi:hypothetical protein
MSVWRTVDEGLRPASPAPMRAMARCGLRIGSVSTALVRAQGLQLMHARHCGLPEGGRGRG